jgi:pimeloyl-ACP methyl ester carboxylesterase
VRREADGSSLRGVTMVERPTVVARLQGGLIEYRLERRGAETILVFHGGHVRAGLPLGEEIFAEAGYTLLAPSRPGYGRTPLTTGRTVSRFADVTRELCRALGIESVSAVVGVSGGGPTAVTMAARHPGVVDRLILQSAVGWLPWPGRFVRAGAHAVFAARTERATWGVVHTVMSVTPGIGLKALLGSLSTLPGREVVARMRTEDRETVSWLFRSMRSGHGFLNDLRPSPDVSRDVRQPALVIATRKDGAVPFAQAESLVAGLCRADLIESQADSHFIWFAPDWPDIAERIRAFLAIDDLPSDR